MATAIASPITVMLSARGNMRMASSRSQQNNNKRALGNFSHFAQVFRKDMEFIKKGTGRGFKWANGVLRIPMVMKNIDDLVWLRNFEDAEARPFSTPWPQPWYPGGLK